MLTNIDREALEIVVQRGEVQRGVIAHEIAERLVSAGLIERCATTYRATDARRLALADVDEQWVTDTVHWSGEAHDVKIALCLSSAGCTLHLPGRAPLVMSIPEWISVALFAMKDASHSQPAIREERRRAHVAAMGPLLQAATAAKKAAERALAAAPPELNDDPAGALETELRATNEQLFRLRHDIESALKRRPTRAWVPGGAQGGIVARARREGHAAGGGSSPKPLHARRSTTSAAIEAGAEYRWVTREGYTRLPQIMLDDLHMSGGGHLWFLKAARWEAWLEGEIEAPPRAAEAGQRRLRPIGARLLVRPAAEQEREGLRGAPFRGDVVAIGPEVTAVVAGATVYYGKYSGIAVCDHVLLDEQEVLAIEEELAPTDGPRRPAPHAYVMSDGTTRLPQRIVAALNLPGPGGGVMFVVRGGVVEMMSDDRFCDAYAEPEQDMKDIAPRDGDEGAKTSVLLARAFGIPEGLDTAAEAAAQHQRLETSTAMIAVAQHFEDGLDQIGDAAEHAMRQALS